MIRDKSKYKPGDRIWRSSYLGHEATTLVKWTETGAVLDYGTGTNKYLLETLHDNEADAILATLSSGMSGTHFERLCEIAPEKAAAHLVAGATGLTVQALNHETRADELREKAKTWRKEAARITSEGEL